MTVMMSTKMDNLCSYRDTAPKRFDLQLLRNADPFSFLRLARCEVGSISNLRSHTALTKTRCRCQPQVKHRHSTAEEQDLIYASSFSHALSAPSNSFKDVAARIEMRLRVIQPNPSSTFLLLLLCYHQLPDISTTVHAPAVLHFTAPHAAAEGKRAVCM